MIDKKLSDNVKKFCDNNNILKSWPTKNHLKQEVLEYLSSFFSYNKIYTEKDINQILINNHSFNEYAYLRRELIESQFLYRTSNGSKYWKAHKYLDNKIETKNLYIENCVINDSIRLTEITKSVSYIEAWTNCKHENDYINQCITDGDLPPSGFKEFYRIKKITRKDDAKIIGFVEFYLGYPEQSNLWISTLYFDQLHQNQGYGQEVIKEISTLSANLGIEEVAVGVHLKNWPALRFWYKNGFCEVLGIYGDKIYAMENFSVMILKKKLSI